MDVRGSLVTRGVAPVLFAAALAGVAAAPPVTPAVGAAPAEAESLPVPAGRRLITLDDLPRFRDVGDPRISPDGAWVAYAVTSVNVEADKRQSDLWMTSWDGATTLRLTTTAKESESHPRWSPDGKSLAFLSSRQDENEADQLWILPRAGGEAECVTEVKQGIDDFAWSPDGGRFVFVVTDSDSVAGDGAGDDGKDGKRVPPTVIDRYYFKEDGTGYLTYKRSHLVLFDLATRALVQLTAGPQDERVPVWSPDGKAIAFLSKRGPDNDRTNSWEVCTIEPRAGAAVRQLTTMEGRVNNPGGENDGNRIEWSPDSRQVAFLQGGPPSLIYYAVNRLAVVPAAGGPVRLLTGGVDQWVSEPRWAPDGASVLAVLEGDRVQHLVRVPATGGAPLPLLAGARTVQTFDVAPDGRIAALVADARTVPEVYALDAGGGEPRRLSRQNDALLDSLRLAPAEETSFKSRDGAAIHGFIVRPPDAKPGTRTPAILWIHGGPVGQFDERLRPEWQLFAARGYTVIAANPRGSTGRGEAFARAIYADWGHKDAQDVLAAVDDAVARGLVDPARLGVGGWSYGGILTNYVIAQDTRFKAATSGASMSNMLAGYGTDEYVREWEGEVGKPWRAASTYLKLSTPFLHADRIVTPTLFFCGEKDFNVPLVHSEQMYQALKSLRRDTQLVIYPGQFHGVSKPSYDRDYVRRCLDWYDRHLR